MQNLSSLLIELLLWLLLLLQLLLLLLLLTFRFYLSVALQYRLCTSNSLACVPLLQLYLNSIKCGFQSAQMNKLTKCILNKSKTISMQESTEKLCFNSTWPLMPTQKHSGQTLLPCFCPIVRCYA